MLIIMCNVATITHSQRLGVAGVCITSEHSVRVAVLHVYHVLLILLYLCTCLEVILPTSLSIAAFTFNSIY